jgi:Post-segregation antitoxin CcdA
MPTLPYPSPRRGRHERSRLLRSFLLWYASSMTTAKRKVSVSLDEDLVEELEREDQGLSAQVNQALRAELERRRRRLLGELLDQLDAEHGPVDESLIEKYTDLLR